MTPRHRYEPSIEEIQQLRGPSMVDCDEESYPYRKARTLHHAQAIANWDKPTGLHKAERPVPAAILKIRKYGHGILSHVNLPIIIHR